MSSLKTKIKDQLRLRREALSSEIAERKEHGLYYAHLAEEIKKISEILNELVDYELVKK